MTWWTVLILITILGSGLVAGVFFAFSSFMMDVFAGLPDRQGMVAMQSVNVIILKSSFMLPLMLTALSSLMLAIVAFRNPSGVGSSLVIAGSLLYLIGSFGVTMIFNVPLNNALAIPNASIELWRSYVGIWTVWNHVRTVASVLAMAALAFALLS